METGQRKRKWSLPLTHLKCILIGLAGKLVVCPGEASATRGRQRYRFAEPKLQNAYHFVIEGRGSDSEYVSDIQITDDHVENACAISAIKEGRARLNGVREDVFL